MRPVLRPLTALLLLAPTLTASTYVIDDDGGPGIDFTSIDQALGSVVPGDVLVVRAGTYSGFPLTVPISIVGNPGAVIAGGIGISNTPAGARTSLAGFETRWITVENCAGPVLLEELHVRSGPPDLGSQFQSLGALIRIRDSADVRLRGIDEVPMVGDEVHGLRVLSSRVEVTHSILRGVDGRQHHIYIPALAGPPGTGGDGINVTGASSVHVSASDVRGGQGGYLPSMDICGCSQAGYGGAGIRMGAGTSVIVTGPAFSSIVGGDFGFAESAGEDGPPGDGIVVGAGASLRASGAAIEPGLPELPFTPPGVPINGPYVQAVPADPTLTIAGPISLQPVTFTVEGEPGSLVTLHLGRQLVVNDVPGVVEDQLVVPLRNYSLGVLPASGIATHTFTMPAVSPQGAIFVAQARTVAPGGAVSLTHSMPLTVH